MSAPSLSLERYRMAVRRMYELLSTAPEGMTIYELCKLSGLPRSTVVIALRDNLLFYIDRWAMTKHGATTRVWCAAEMKKYEDCPRPENL